VSLATRVVARIDIKRSIGAIKGRRLDGLRRVGDAAELALKYEAQGADEILMLDITASLYQQPLALEYATAAVDRLHTPLTFGGGVRSFQDFAQVIRRVGEKVALCSAPLFKPELITRCAEAYGSQAVVVEVQVRGDQAYHHAGRQPAQWRALDWCREAVDCGAGELLITSVDGDGLGTGHDLDFLAKLAPRVTVPIVASGGAGCPWHCVEAIQAGASAVAVGTYLHGGGTVGAIKAALARIGVD